MLTFGAALGVLFFLFVAYRVVSRSNEHRGFVNGKRKVDVKAAQETGWADGFTGDE